MRRGAGVKNAPLAQRGAANQAIGARKRKVDTSLTVRDGQPAVLLLDLEAIVANVGVRVTTHCVLAFQLRLIVVGGGSRLLLCVAWAGLVRHIVLGRVHRCAAGRVVSAALADERFAGRPRHGAPALARRPERRTLLQCGVTQLQRSGGRLRRRFHAAVPGRKRRSAGEGR